MKFIKQKSTDKIVFRESPHSDKTITNAVIVTKIDLSDLEIVEESWSEDDWHTNTVPYQDKRKSEYASIPEQLDYIYHNGVEKWKTDMILPVKEKYPKGAE
jgi:hypothetical protein